ncbi:tRNA (N6-threonylcarbamoyladenosine(37)-N6)-methyltransferase TrmO [Nonomuraea basaltis]|nr:tRNA (N6-threonylcarbamoyladenosine(37)-N6)-methyltransferase TrmO [Nonomuraea basaltis]
MNRPLRGQRLTALADGAAVPTSLRVAVTLGPSGILTLIAAETGTAQLVQPGLDVPNGQLVEPLGAERWRDVEPGEHLVVRHRLGREVGFHDVREPVRQVVRELLVDREMAPKQGDEGAPDAWLVFEPDVREGLRDLRAGEEVIVLTWLDRADRDVLVVHPRGDATRPETGVFSTRSPDRPNPIGLHRVKIVSIDGTRVRVQNLEALDATPIIDVKPVLDQTTER